METIEAIPRPRLWPKVAAAGMAVLAIVGIEACSWNDLNPSGSATHGADSDAGSTQEIQQNYPGATNIEVTHSDDNPNYMSWDLPNGERCTAFASRTQNKGRTPGRLISVPYCRELPE